MSNIKRKNNNAHTEKIILRGEERRSRELSPIPAFLFLLCGVFGMLLLFGSLPGIYFEKATAYTASAVWCAAFTFLFYKSRKYFYTAAACAAALIALTAVFSRGLLGAQLSYIGDALTGAPAAEPPSVTMLVLMFLPGAAAAVLLFESAAFGIPLTLLSALLIPAAPLLGAKNGLTTVFLLSLTSAGVWALNARDCGGWRNKAAALTCAVLAALIAASAVFVYPAADRLSDLTYSAEGRIFRFIAEKTGRSADLVQGGKVSRFNNYLTDRGQLIVQITRAPKEPIYLKGFVGGDYSNGEWEAADDTSILNDIQNKYQNNWGVLGITNTYSSLYFTMNLNTMDESIPSPGSMAVRYISSEGKNYYVPYYSRVETIYVYGGYRFQYYEKNDMRINWNNVPQVYERKRDQCLNLQAAYSEEAAKIYTRLPGDRLPRLRKLCGGKEFESLSEITDFIKNTLSERTEYTLTPGMSTPGGDPVEEFLFDRGRGYCVHYASAATLMYRLLGVPARYVTGYLIEPSDFERQRYGTYNAELKDKNAHAWVEIFLQDYGWTPIEMTPSASGETETEIYPGYSEPKGKEAETGGGKSLNISLIPKNRGETEADTQDDASEGGDAEISDETTDYAAYEKTEKPIRTAAAIIFSAAPIAAVLLLIIRKMRRRRRADCRREFARLTEALETAGMMRGYDGTEPDFCEKLCEALPDTDTAELRHMVAAVSKAAYAAVPPDDGDNAAAVKTCRTAVSSVRKTMSPYKKLVFAIKELIN